MQACAPGLRRDMRGAEVEELAKLPFRDLEDLAKEQGMKEEEFEYISSRPPKERADLFAKRIIALSYFRQGGALGLCCTSPHVSLIETLPRPSLPGFLSEGFSFILKAWQASWGRP
ncbi:MAG: hypothetical protein Q8P12_00165 [bacterium]|nr:hypothetical protein [bacterium]